MAENQTDPIVHNSTSFYSQRAILLATYLGGPLAAGILIQRNFNNFGKKAAGKNALFLAIVFTVLLFVVLFSLPEHILDKIPNILIPAVYTAITALIVERLHGKLLKEHKEKNGRFYSIWKAVGIGVICVIIYITGVLAYVFIVPENFDTAKYDAGIDRFTKNEMAALELFNLLETQEPDEISHFIQKKGIPKWKKNILILNELQ